LHVKIKNFVEKYGQPFSEMLGIDVASSKSGEIAKWFLASILYSKPIRESSATATYKVFEEHGVVTPSKIAEAGWDGLVSLLDEGGYTRYDFSTAERLLEIFGNIHRNYYDDLNRLHALATNSRDLERKLKDLGKGIGDTTVSIFLRDMRGAWSKADPDPSRLVRAGMKKLKIKDLKRFAKANRLDIVRLETALLRLAKDFLRKGKRLEIE
jgi:hypothetical protein